MAASLSQGRSAGFFDRDPEGLATFRARLALVKRYRVAARASIMTKGRCARSWSGYLRIVCAPGGSFGTAVASVARHRFTIAAFPVAEKIAVVASLCRRTPKKGFRLAHFQKCCSRRTVGDARTSRREAATGPKPQSYLKCSNTVPPASGRRFPGCESRRVLRPELRPVISRWRRPIFGRQPQKISSAAVA